MIRLRWKNDSGAAAMEFGLVIIPLMVLLMGGIDLGYQVYIRSVTQGALDNAIRQTSIQNANSTNIETRLTEQIQRTLPGVAVTITKGSFYRFNNLDTMERLTVDLNGNNVLDGRVDTDGNGIPDKSDCWEDVDNNGARNVVTAGRDGIGGADDIVRYNATVSYNRLLPIYNLVNMPRLVTFTAVGMVRRQPFEGQAQPVTRCVP